eukprot:157153_1
MQLLLASGGFLVLLGDAALALAPELGVNAELLDLGVDLGVLLLAGDLASLDAAGRGDDGEGHLGGNLDGGGASLSVGVTSLGLGGLAGEDNKLGLVELEAVEVGVEVLLGAVDAAVINGDANATGRLHGDLGGLKLGKSETTASTHTHVVLDGGATDGGAQEVDGAGSHLLGLGDASVTASLLLGGLVEPGHNVTLPVLAEVLVLDLLVVLHTASNKYKLK